MDRRGFFKTLLATPLLTPYLLASKKESQGLELLVIADKPQQYLPFILKELRTYGLVEGHTFSFLSAHPQAGELSRALQQMGWHPAPGAARARLALSFSQLQHRAFPSFTVVKDGQIWDIRTRKLHSLWEKMSQTAELSASLTMASLTDSQQMLNKGKSVFLFKDGRKVESLSLDRNAARTFHTSNGKISVRVEDGAVRVVESSCRHKICLMTPPASLAGERIICAPNHFLLEVNGGSSIDTVLG